MIFQGKSQVLLILVLAIVFCFVLCAQLILLLDRILTGPFLGAGNRKKPKVSSVEAGSTLHAAVVAAAAALVDVLDILP